MTREEVNVNIGKKVFLIGNDFFPIYKNMVKYFDPLNGKDSLEIIKLTKSGMAYLKDSCGGTYSIPPKNIKLI